MRLRESSILKLLINNIVRTKIIGHYSLLGIQTPLPEVINTRVVSKYFRLLAQFALICFPPTFKMKIFFVFSVFYHCEKFRVMTNFNCPTCGEENGEETRNATCTG